MQLITWRWYVKNRYFEKYQKSTIMLAKSLFFSKWLANLNGFGIKRYTWERMWKNPFINKVWGTGRQINKTGTKFSLQCNCKNFVFKKYFDQKPLTKPLWRLNINKNQDTFKNYCFKLKWLPPLLSSLQWYSSRSTMVLCCFTVVWFYYVMFMYVYMVCWILIHYV